MITIGRMPRKTQRFFKPLRDQFAQTAWDYFWGMVVAMTISHGSALERLAKLLGGSTHRTNHGEFLWRSDWSESAVIGRIALDTLRRLRRRNRRRCYPIIDETQRLKRAKEVRGAGKLFHHSTGKYGTGHTIVKVCLHYRGVTIPWGSWLWVKPADARNQKEPFLKLAQSAALSIHNADLPRGLQVAVLFDCCCPCPMVVDACAARGWHHVSVGKSDRNFTVGETKRCLDGYGRNVLRRSGCWHKIQGLRKSGMCRLAERTGQLSKLGRGKVVFSRRRGERKVLALVTDDLRVSMRTVVSDYEKRWAIELLIKDEKQQLGLADYRVLRYRAVVRHLNLVDAAYACLTHLTLGEGSSEGQRKNQKLLHLLPISQLKTRMRQIVWREAVDNVVRHSHERPVLRRLEKFLAA